jgi:hypothetical protein
LEKVFEDLEHEEQEGKVMPSVDSSTNPDTQPHGVTDSIGDF